MTRQISKVTLSKGSPWQTTITLEAIVMAGEDPIITIERGDLELVISCDLIELQMLRNVLTQIIMISEGVLADADE